MRRPPSFLLCALAVLLLTACGQEDAKDDPTTQQDGLGQPGDVSDAGSASDGGLSADGGLGADGSQSPDSATADVAAAPDSAADTASTANTCNATHADHTVGLISCTPQAWAGYTFFSPTQGTNTYLIDMQGRVTHTWPSSHMPGLGVYLLDDGSIMRTARVPAAIKHFEPAGAGGRVQHIDWEGDVVWEYTYATETHLQHHDIEPMPNGNVLLIAWEKKSKEDVIAAGRDPSLIDAGELWVDHIIEVKPKGKQGGEIVWEWHLWDHLVQDFDPKKANHGVIKEHPELMNINSGNGGKADWSHANSVAYNAKLDIIALSLNAQNEFIFIDHSTTKAEAAGHSGGKHGKGGDILYRWGNPANYGLGTTADRFFYGNHDVHWIPDGLPGAGDLLIFNNGGARPEGEYSSVEQITPPLQPDGSYLREAGKPWGPAKPTWHFQAAKPTDFYSRAVSGAQRLPNGNTLICEGNDGTFFEVTPQGAEVWRYVNPVTNKGITRQGETPTPGPKGAVHPVFRVRRFGADHPALKGRALIPGDPIELPPKG